MALPSIGMTAVTPQEKVFYQTLGQRIARLRKDKNITQVQLAETLGVAQQTLAHYEVGRLRLAVTTLATLAKALEVTVEELIEEHTTTRHKRGPASKLEQQLEQISSLPRAKQQFVIQMLDTVLQQAS